MWIGKKASLIVSVKGWRFSWDWKVDTWIYIPNSNVVAQTGWRGREDMRKTSSKLDKKAAFFELRDNAMRLKSWHHKKGHLGPILNLQSKFQRFSPNKRKGEECMLKMSSKNEKTWRKMHIFWSWERMQWGLESRNPQSRIIASIKFTYQISTYQLNLTRR